MKVRPRRTPRARPVAPLALALASACIIPDSHIRVVGDFVDEGAVRIVHPIYITDEADVACSEIEDGGGLEGCPGVPAGLPTGLLAGNFCTCAAGERDGRAALRFDIYVEDPDVDEDGRPSDDILGVFLLDVPEGAREDPTPYVAYSDYLPPDQPAALFTAGEFPAIERPNPNLRSWTIGEDVVDLCNDNQGQPLAGLEPLGADGDPPQEDGLHELRLVVTDRPWYRPPLQDDDGEVVFDDEGEIMLGDPMFGVPDLAAGATYDTRSFVFRCYSPAAPPPGDCSCQAPEEP